MSENEKKEQGFSSGVKAAEITTALKEGGCPHFADGVVCEYPDTGCLECDPVAVASRWLYPRTPRKWETGGSRAPRRAEYFLREMLTALKDMGK